MSQEQLSFWPVACNGLRRGGGYEIHYDSFCVLSGGFDFDWCSPWGSVDRVLALQHFGGRSQGRLSLCGFRGFLCSDAEGLVTTEVGLTARG